MYRAGFVSIVGRPNSGKSTLLNALVGQKVAITARQAQTTRTAVQGVLTTPEFQAVFVDTPGIHKSDSLFHKRMMDTVRSTLENRDLILFLVDGAKKLGEEDQHAVSAMPDGSTALLIVNKVDRVEDKRLLLPLIESYSPLFPFAEVFPISARTGEGLEALKRSIERLLPEGPALFADDYLTDQPMRFLAGEIIRERILYSVNQEVPHAVAVLIDQWEEKPNLARIAATVYVEKPGQKAILIGNGGSMMKKIGTEARTELEAMLGHKVFLSVFVKVKPNWREDQDFLTAIDWKSMIGSEDR